MTQKAKKTDSYADARKRHAAAEYQRLLTLYEEAGVDPQKLKINETLIRKVAELYGILEAIKDLPTLTFKGGNPSVTQETAAGKCRVKYMAQYSSCMLKLNRDLLGDADAEDGNGLTDYEDGE